MNKFLWIITFSLFLIVSCSLSGSGPGIGYYPATGGQQEYGSHMGDMGDMDFNDMYNYLAPYGNWVNLAPYGYVWTPRNMGYRWRPYSYGHWVYTDYGWTWISNEEWGSIPFHYGRWGYDNDFGWFWVPGTDWGPAWVSWRQSSQYVGWAPLPPEADFRTGRGFISLSFRIPNRFWIFLQALHFQDNDIHRYALPYERNGTIINFTSLLHNNIYYRNNRIINEGIGLDYVRRVTRRPVPRYTIRDVRNSRQRRVVGNDALVYRPTLRKNTAAKPKTYLDRDDARRKLKLVKVYDPRLKTPVIELERNVQRRQAEQKALVEKTQEQELKNIELKRSRALAQAHDKAEKTKISQAQQVKLNKLQQRHQAEKQKLNKRNKQDIERVKQIAQQVKQKKQSQKQDNKNNKNNKNNKDNKKKKQ